MKFSPHNYSIHFKPDLNNFTFTAHQILTFEVTEPLDQISLDCIDLTIQNVKMSNKELAFSTQENMLVIELGESLTEGMHKIHIEFAGTINDGLAGWYRSGYTVDGETKYIATTHFEAADARRAFPCVDHPLYKATFNISFEIDPTLKAVSNTLPEEEKTLDNGNKLIVFTRTPVMSTYLVYLGVGEFEFKEETYKDIRIRGITTPGKKEHTTYAIDCARKSLEFYEQYFDYPYPLDTLDLIAIPDFAAGAMENWGAVTFRENALLYYEGQSSIATKQRIAEVVAHEVAHQWFGNLVTMKWWDDLWLNESFATFMAYKVIDRYWPEWEIWKDYVTTMVFGGMELDSLRSSHSIQVEVKNVDEINELFDEIAYDKGGSVLRMLEGFLGEDTFREGLRKYIATHRYKNTKGEDLWNSLESVSSTSILDLMHSYIKQVGFPVVSADQEGNTLKLSQERFLMLPAETKELWSIPLVLHTDKEVKPQLISQKNEQISFSDNPEFVYLNNEYTGFYVSQYSSTMLEAIGAHITRLSAIDRIGLVHDINYLVMSGKTSLDTLLNFIEKYMKDEKDASVLSYIIGKLAGKFLLIENKHCQNLALEFSRKAIEMVGYEPKKDESATSTHMRAIALDVLSLFEDEKTATFGSEKFSQYLKDPKTLHPDLRSIIFMIAVRTDDKNHDVIFNLYKKSDNQEERAKYLAALGGTKNTELIKKTLELILSEHVRFAQSVYVVGGLVRNPLAKGYNLDWLISHWKDLEKTGGGMAHMLLRRYLKAIIPFSGIGREDEVKKFFKDNTSESLTKTFEQTWEELEINSNFVNKNKANT